MKDIKVNLSEGIKELKVLLISDLHIGAPEANMTKIHETIEQLKNEEDTYCVLGGDLIDNAIIDSVGDVFEQQLTPMGQIGLITSLFQPVKEKILAVVQGNHEYRSYKKTGLDLTALFCAELRIQERYDPVATLLFIRLGEIEKSNYRVGEKKGRQVLYTMYLTHGSGGGRSTGAKANSLERIGNNINADIICVGHSHLPLTFRQNVYNIDVQNSSHYQREQVFINMSSTLGYGGYAEKYALKPSSMNAPYLILSGRRKEIKVIA